MAVTTLGKSEQASVEWIEWIGGKVECQLTTLPCLAAPLARAPVAHDVNRTQFGVNQQVPRCWTTINTHTRMAYTEAVPQSSAKHFVDGQREAPRAWPRLQNGTRTRVRAPHAAATHLFKFARKGVHEPDGGDHWPWLFPKA